LTPRRPRRRLAALAAAFACGAAPAPAAAFDARGHAAIGAVADRLVAGTPAAARVRELLHGRTLAEAAVWADCAKGVRSDDGEHFRYEPRGGECRIFETEDGIAAMTRYVRRNWTQCGDAAGSQMCHHRYHYADLSTLRARYDARATGASDHDVVHAIAASAAAAACGETPRPFDFADPGEALRVLAHVVGDLHQPLHLQSPWLAADGRVLDPDAPGGPRAFASEGGNRIAAGDATLHALWDAVDPAWSRPGPELDRLATLAAGVPRPPGGPAAWPQAWADDVMRSSRAAFAPLAFAPDGERRWQARGVDRDYLQAVQALKRREIAAAGARLAQMVVATLPGRCEAR